MWTTEDQTVVPPSSAELGGALAFTVQSVCPGARTSHGDLTRDPVVLAAVDTVLGARSPEPPPDVVCRPDAL